MEYLPRALAFLCGHCPIHPNNYFRHAATGQHYRAMLKCALMQLFWLHHPAVEQPCNIMLNRIPPTGFSPQSRVQRPAVKRRAQLAPCLLVLPLSNNWSDHALSDRGAPRGSSASMRRVFKRSRGAVLRGYYVRFINDALGIIYIHSPSLKPSRNRKRRFPPKPFHTWRFAASICISRKWLSSRVPHVRGAKKFYSRGF